MRRRFEIRRRLLGEDNVATAITYNSLAGNLTHQGNYRAAQPLYEKALAIGRRVRAEDDPETAHCYNDLAANYTLQGQYTAAQPLAEKSLEIARRILSDNHPHTATCMNNLANILHHQGKFAKAQLMNEQTLAIRRAVLTDNHPDTAMSYNNLATNLMSQKKYKPAQPLFEKALEIRRRLLTENHPDTAQSYDNLATNLKLQEQYAAAQPYYEKSLDIYRRLLGDEHPDVAIVTSNLGHNLRDQGKHAAAQALFEKCLAIDLKNESDIARALSYSGLAHNLNALGQYGQARDQWILAARAFEAARLSVASTGLDRASAHASNPLKALAAVHARLGQPVEAWQRLEEDLGRGLLDELFARKDQRLSIAERTELEQVLARLERLDRLFEAPMQNLEQAERQTRLETLRQDRDRARIALGDLRSRLARKYGPLAGKVESRSENPTGARG